MSLSCCCYSRFASYRELDLFRVAHCLVFSLCVFLPRVASFPFVGLVSMNDGASSDMDIAGWRIQYVRFIFWLPLFPSLTWHDGCCAHHALNCVTAPSIAHIVEKALLLALGIKSRRLGAAAAMSWVLKDALGKFGRILWASKMGRRFDSDAKRWRFRSR